MSNFDEKKKYLGEKIMLFPHDSVKKYGIIEDVDNFGFIIKLTEVGSANYSHEWKVGDRYFCSHNNITFKFVN